MIDLNDGFVGDFVRVGDVLRYSGTVHGSVGLSFKAVYDETAFSVEQKIIYDTLEKMKMMEGADRARLELYFTALRECDEQIRILHDFRGNVYKEEIFYIKVY